MGIGRLGSDTPELLSATLPTRNRHVRVSAASDNIKFCRCVNIISSVLKLISEVLDSSVKKLDPLMGIYVFHHLNFLIACDEVIDDIKARDGICLCYHGRTNLYIFTLLKLLN